MVDLAPFGLREQFDQIFFDVHGVGVLGEPEAAGDALDVRIHGKALIDAETAPQDHVGRLAGHARQFDEVFHGSGRLAVELLHDELGGGDEVFRLAVIEPDGMDDFFEFGDGGLGESRRIGPAAEQFGRDLIHALVRALGGEHCGDEQFPRVFGHKMGFEIGIALGEQVKDFGGALFVCHGRFLHAWWRVAGDAAMRSGRCFRPERRKQTIRSGSRNAKRLKRPMQGADE